MTAGGSEYGEPVIRDKRRIDPETGQVRQPSPAPSSDSGPAPERSGPVGTAEPVADPVAGTSELEAALAERTSDLQRLQAEYVNYKRRVDRDRAVVKETAVAAVLTSLLPVLDDIGRARDHDELTGGFKAVADSLERTVSGLGLEPFGAAGDSFDPRIHEALMHSYSDDVDGPVAQAVLQVGYRLGDRVVRPARVAVVEPENASAPEGSEAEAVADEVAPGRSAAVADEGAEAGVAGPPPQASYPAGDDSERENDSDPAPDRDT